MSDLWTKAKELITVTEPWAISMRRYLHKTPELSGMEFSTAAKIEKELENMGIEVFRTAETGVIGMIHGKNDGKVVAIRADIDALPLQEKNKSDFSSAKDGVMHACGHDAHTAILLGTAKVLAGLKSDLNGTVKLFFQPAEETIGGAERMIDEGCMNEPKVDYVIGLHVMPHIEAGKVELKYNKLNAASDMVKINVMGKSTHGAYPEEGTDAIIAASQIIINLQSVITRRISPLNQVVLSFGSMHGGNKENIICNEMEMKGTLRTLDEKTRAFVKNTIEEVVKYTAKANGARAFIEFEEGYKSLNNNDEVMDIIVEAAKEAVGCDRIVMKEQPSLGVEDFSYFLDHAKGAFFHLGCGNPNKKNAPLHSDAFELNEGCISVGIRMEVLSSLKLLRE